MKFCDKCGNLMFTKKQNRTSGWYCRKCNFFVKDVNAKTSFISEKIHVDDSVKKFKEDDNYSQYPKAKARCGKCGNTEAYWALQQTRAADEPQTKFFCCTKCKHKWREY